LLSTQAVELLSLMETWFTYRCLYDSLMPVKWTSKLM
jgi:hypothetical protein